MQVRFLFVSFLFLGRQGISTFCITFSVKSNYEISDKSEKAAAEHRRQFKPLLCLGTAVFCFFLNLRSWKKLRLWMWGDIRGELVQPTFRLSKWRHTIIIINVLNASSKPFLTLKNVRVQSDRESKKTVIKTFFFLSTREFPSQFNYNFKCKLK